MSAVSGRIIDAWMQHPTLRHSNHAMFESLRRWAGLEGDLDEPLPLELTIASMDEGKVDLGLIAAWYGPEGSLISNDEVADFTACYPDRLRAVAGADLRKPMEAVRELRQRRRRGLLRAPDRSVAVGTTADRPTLLSAVCRLRRPRHSILHPGRPHRSAPAVRNGPTDSVHRSGRNRFPRAGRSSAATSAIPGPRR